MGGVALRDMRCGCCGRLLARVIGGRVQIKCPRCGHIEETAPPPGDGARMLPEGGDGTKGAVRR